MFDLQFGFYDLYVYIQILRSIGPHGGQSIKKLILMQLRV